MAARVPDRSESAPWRSGVFTYREVHEAGAEFPTLVRRTGDGPDESVIDLQKVADAHPGAEFHRGELEVSPDGRMLAWSYDVVGDERYGLRFRDLRTGSGPARRHRGDLPEWRLERRRDDVSVSAH